MATCRNCGSSNILRIENGGVIAPFFADRVYGIKLERNKSRKGKLVDLITLGAGRIFAKKMTNMFTDASICRDCTFYSTYRQVPAELLYNLYRDYRSYSYNQDRESYERGYIANIGCTIGGLNEAEIRNSHLNEYFKVLEEENICSLVNCKNALDWGGADGRFLPSFPGKCLKYVYEVSDCNPAQGVVKIDSIPDLNSFEYIQIAHVFEHVSSPLEFIEDPVKSLLPGGFLYIEVPVEVVSLNLVNDVQDRRTILYVHEHINKYTSEAIRQLVETQKMHILDIRQDEVIFPWCKSEVIRLVARKPN